jgi:SAM-dependent methyltransferase
MPAPEAKETKSNRELWNNLAQVHFDSKFYDLRGFLKGKSALNAIEQRLLGDVRGKSVLHLQCHFGLGTLSLARAGAVVTGVDFSEVAVAKARELNEKLGLDARFITCDVNQLDRFLDGKFDVVYASFGVIGWHCDLGNWARIISHFLKRNGRFCFAEFHPVLWMLGDDHSNIGYSYFKSGVITETNPKSYADPAAKIVGTSFCWNHSLGEVFGALEGQGLAVKNFEEYDYLPYRSFPDAVGRSGRYRVKGLERMLPLAYSLTASRER